MPFKLLHPIKSKIYNQYQLIESLISDFPDMQRLWHRKMEAIFRHEASEISEGDKEIQISEFLQMSRLFEEQRDYNYFYNAMLILVFSYYEDLMISIHNNEFPNSLTDTIPMMSDFCNKKGITLSSDSKNNVDFIYNKVRLLRNYIAHSKWGRQKNSPSDIATIKSLEADYPDIHLDDNSIFLSGNTFLLAALKKEKAVLLELSEKLGYTNKSMHNDQG